LAPTMAPDVTPLLSREKPYLQSAVGRKYSNPLFVLLFVSIVLLLGAGLVRTFFKPTQVKDTIKVVAAGKDVPAGCRLGFTSLHYLEIPRRYLTPDMASSFEQIAGRVTRTFIPTGEPIVTNMLLPGKNGLSLALNTDQRAITLKLDDEALVDRSLCPGDSVDVLVTASSKDGKKYTKTLCQQVLVLLSVPKEAFLSQALRTSDQNRVTLAVSPEQAEQLTEGSEAGKLRLVLRNRVSSDKVNLPGVDERDLLPSQALIAPEPSKPVVLAPAQAAFLPPPPPPMGQDRIFKEATLPAKNPLQWVVDVFKGSRKETYAFAQNQE